MALVAANRPVTVSVTIEDRDGNRRPASITFPGTLTIADILANLAATEAVIAGITNGNIVGGSVNIPLLQDTPPALAPEASDVERKGTFVFRTAAGTYAKYEVPSVDPAIVVDNSNVIDPANAAVAAYVAFMQNGYPGAANGPVTGAGTQLESLFSAKKTHRASSKG